MGFAHAYSADVAGGDATFEQWFGHGLGAFQGQGGVVAGQPDALGILDTDLGKVIAIGKLMNDFLHGGQVIKDDTHFDAVADGAGDIVQFVNHDAVFRRRWAIRWGIADVGYSIWGDAVEMPQCSGMFGRDHTKIHGSRRWNPAGIAHDAEHGFFDVLVFIFVAETRFGLRGSNIAQFGMGIRPTAR